MSRHARLVCADSSLTPWAPPATLVGLLALAVTGLHAADWPQWRGPARDGISTETGLLQEWPKEGPKLLWQTTNIGSGYAAPAVVKDRLYVLGNEGLDNEFIQAIAVRDGMRAWSTSLGKVGNPKQQPNFPAARSTPTFDGERLYALGSDGDLACLEPVGGKVIWRKNLRADFQGKPGDWAYSESPLIDGDTLICTPGGREATLLALNKKTGGVLWKCALPEGDDAAYASPVIAEAGGIKQYVQFLQKGLVGVEARTGKFLWRYTKTVSRFRANIPTPVACKDHVYSGGAGTGGGVVKIEPGNGGFAASEICFSPKLPSAVGGAVKVGDYLYGTTAQLLLCLNFPSGDIKWEDRALGAAALCYADHRLYLHGENGQVALVEATSDGFREHGRFSPLNQPTRKEQMEKSWAYPVVADGRFYLRDQNVLWCYDIKASAGTRAGR